MIKRAQSQIKQAQLASLAETYRFTVAGNYHAEASHLIKAALLRKLLAVKKLVLGTRAKTLTLVLESTDGLSSLAARTCRQVGIGVKIEPDMTAEQRAVMPLVLTIKLVPGPKIPETTADQLTDQYDKAVEPWDDSEGKFEIGVPVATELKARPPVDLTKLDNPNPVNDKRNGYGPFAEIDQWVDENIVEVEPSIDRNDIPEYGPDIPPDGNKAGGLQQS